MPYEMPTTGDQLIWDIWLSQHLLPALTVAEEIGLFEAIAREGKTTGALAEELEADPFVLGVLLSMVAAMGLAEHRIERWHATDASRIYLLPDSPFSWSPVFRRYRTTLPSHVQFREALKQGSPEEEGQHVVAWASGVLGILQARQVAGFMHAHSLPSAIAVARSGVFKGVRRLLDVGGGSGCYAVAIAQHEPELNATILDLPAMCKAAQDYIDTGEVDGRVDTIAVDMFREPWPDGYDALFFSNIFHDWRPETCAELAGKAFAALPSGGRIVLHEMLLGDNKDGPLTATAFSMLMLLGTRGRQYSLVEFRDILQDAGFTDVGATHTCGYYSLVSATKP